MDRRVFLKTSARAAALSVAAVAAPAVLARPLQHLQMTAAPGFSGLARAFGRRVAALTSGRVAITVLPELFSNISSAGEPADGHIGTLHQAADVHPGFAFFAGLPGALGMSADVAQRWRETLAAELWLELQAAAGVACIPLGATDGAGRLWSNHPITTSHDVYGRRLACEGLARDVARGIGALPAHAGELNSGSIVHGLGFEADVALHLPERFSCFSSPAITRVASTRAIMLPDSVWQTLPRDVRDAMHLAARQMTGSTAMVRQRDAASALRPGPLDPAFTATIDRVAEAVVADISGADQLTRRINAGYFAVHPDGPHPSG